MLIRIGRGINNLYRGGKQTKKTNLSQDESFLLAPHHFARHVHFIRTLKPTAVALFFERSWKLGASSVNELDILRFDPFRPHLGEICLLCTAENTLIVTEWHRYLLKIKTI